MNDLLTPALFRMIKSSDNSGYFFFAQLVARMKRKFTTKIPTAGVTPTAQGVTLLVNPDWFGSQTPDVQVGTLVHECMHVIQGHLTRVEGRNRRLWDVATDVAINQYIKEFAGLEDTFLFPKAIPGAPTHVHAEEYYRLAEKEIDKQRKKGRGDGERGDGFGDPFDDHSGWQTDVPAEVAEQAVRNAVKEARDAMVRAAGNLPANLEAAIDSLLAPKLPWKKLLRRFAANAEECITESTRKRPNRRFDFLYPGTRREPRLHLAVAVDTSGSMSDETLREVFSEIDGIVKGGAIVTVIEADCEVKDVYPWRSGQVPKPKGRGGTAYQPAIDKAAELKADALIYMGDMDSSDKPTKPNMPVLWVSFGGQTPPADWGVTVNV